MQEAGTEIEFSWMTSVFYLQGQIKSDGMGGAIKLLTIGKFL
jgi:hypothetical protein